MDDMDMRALMAKADGPEFSPALHEATMRRLDGARMRSSISPSRSPWLRIAIAAAVLIGLSLLIRVRPHAPERDTPTRLVVAKHLPLITASEIFGKGEMVCQLTANVTTEPLGGLADDARSFVGFLARQIPSDSLRRPANTPPPTRPGMPPA